MDGSAELRQLAHLLRVGANAARDIASIRMRDVREIHSLAIRAEDMAEEIDAIAAGAPPATDGWMSKLTNG